MKILEQGDVLFFKEKIPTDLIKLKTNIVQEGEATGHAHRLFEGEYELLEQPKTKERYLRVITPTQLKHEEHHSFIIPPGDYRIGIVKEYDHFSEEAREVAD